MSFSILGAVISIQILVIGILAIMSMSTAFMSQARIESDKIIALGLAQEGIEIVRNIRDGNFLEGAAWKTGLNNGSGYVVDYMTESLLGPAGGRILYDSDKFYSMASANATKFIRNIDISSGSDDGGEFIYPKCTVSWSEFGRSYAIKLEEKLYNWQKQL